MTSVWGPDSAAWDMRRLRRLRPGRRAPFFLVLDAAGMILGCSAGAEAFLGRDPAELAGRPLPVLTGAPPAGDADPVRLLMRHAASPGREAGVRVHLAPAAPPQPPRPAYLTLQAVRGAGDGASAWIARLWPLASPPPGQAPADLPAEVPGDVAAHGGAPPGLAPGLADAFGGLLAVISESLELAERHAAGHEDLPSLLAGIREAAERGSEFGLRLADAGGRGQPARAEPTPPAQEQPRAAPAARILVVEDDPDIAELAVTVLEQLGYHVDLAHDAAAALSLLRTRGRIDLGFSDIVMPGGMSGIDLAERVRSEYPSVPVLLATGYSAAALSPGALKFPVLAKPYSLRELARRVAQMIDPGPPPGGTDPPGPARGAG